MADTKFQLAFSVTASREQVCCQRSIMIVFMRTLYSFASWATRSGLGHLLISSLRYVSSCVQKGGRLATAQGTHWRVAFRSTSATLVSK